MMDDYASLSHTRWECQYHVVFIPKCRRKVFFGRIRKDLGRVFAELARQKECRIEAGSLQPDHVHMLISIPPKHSVAQVIEYIKGKSAIYIARTYGKGIRSFIGEHFWARGYFVSTVGKGEEAIRQYVESQGTTSCTRRFGSLQSPATDHTWKSHAIKDNMKWQSA